MNKIIGERISWMLTSLRYKYVQVKLASSCESNLKVQYIKKLRNITYIKSNCSVIMRWNLKL